MRAPPAVTFCLGLVALLLGAAAQEDGFVVHAVALAPDGSAAAFGRVTDLGDDGCILLREAGRDAPVRLCSAGIVRALAFAPDGQSLFVTDDAGRVRQIARDGKSLGNFELGQLPGFCSGVAVSPDGARVAALDHEKRLQCFEVASGKRLFLRVLEALPVCVVFLPDGRLAVGDNAGAVTLYSRQGEPGERLCLLDSSVVSLATDGTGMKLAAGDWNGSVCVIDLASGARRDRPATKKRLYALAFSPDGKHLAVAGSETGVAVWSIATDRTELWPAARSMGALRWLPARDGSPAALYGADHRGGVHELRAQ